jgi:hypothetical protein
MGPKGCPETSVNNDLRCLTSQNNEVLKIMNYVVLVFLSLVPCVRYCPCIGWKNTEIVRQMNRIHWIIQVYSEEERRRKFNQLQMDAVSFVPACTSPMQESCSEVAVEGCFSACKVSGTDEY